MNIEDFDMPRDEAIKSAIEEFNVQGYDLSGVVTNMAGSDVQRCVQRLASCLAHQRLSKAKGVDRPRSRLQSCMQSVRVYVKPRAHGAHLHPR